MKKIGIDIDDTICDTCKIVLPVLCNYYNIDIYSLEKSIIETGSLPNLKNYDIFAHNYYPLIIPNLPLLTDAKKYINKLKEQYEIIFITARNTLGLEESYKISYNYLKKNGVLFDKLIVNSTNKCQICKDNKIDYFIDNNFVNCRSVSKLSNVNVILFGDKYNNNITNLKRIDSWKEIYNFIIKGE